MRVLFVSSGNHTSGIPNLIENQANSLTELGVSVEFFLIKGKGILGYLLNIIPLRQQIRSNQYDIIHAHYGLCGFVALIAKKSKSKLVISFMGNDLLGDHAKNGKTTIYGDILVSLSKLCSRYADYVIVKSNEMAEAISNSRKAIVPNGVDLEQFNLVDKRIAIGKIGWERHLRHIFFMADPTRPEKNYALACKAMASLNLKDIQMHFMQNIDSQETVFYYNASDVCLLTSYHEGSPNVIKEAMACSCSIVCTPVGDVTEVFGNTEGCYVTSYDPKDITAKIIKSLEFSERTGKTKGRDRVQYLKLDRKSIAIKIMGIYMKVIHGPN